MEIAKQFTVSVIVPTRAQDSHWAVYAQYVNHRGIAFDHPTQVCLLDIFAYFSYLYWAFIARSTLLTTFEKFGVQQEFTVYPGKAFVCEYAHFPLLLVERFS